MAMLFSRMLLFLALCFGPLPALAQPGQMQFDFAEQIELQDYPGPTLSGKLPIPSPRDLAQVPMPDVSVFDDYFWVDLQQTSEEPAPKSACAACYPGPEIAPMPVPVPVGGGATGPGPALGPMPTLSRRGGTLGLQMQLLSLVSEDDICRAVVQRVLQQAEPCSNGRFDTPANYVEVLIGGESMPVFLLHVASRSENLTQYDLRAFEAHRYYLMFVVDPDMRMNMLLFDYEPLFNTAPNIKAVLNRFQDNTDYIPVKANEGIVALTTRVRVAVSGMLTDLARQ